MTVDYLVTVGKHGDVNFWDAHDAHPYKGFRYWKHTNKLAEMNFALTPDAWEEYDYPFAPDWIDEFVEQNNITWETEEPVLIKLEIKTV